MADGTSSQHSGTQSAAAAEAALPRKSPPSLAFYKTKLCPHIQQRGRCGKGPSCVFAHSETELRCPPNLTKTKLCPQIRRGETCPNDEATCPFAHSLDALRHTDDLFKTKYCHMWKKGKCTAGETCRHAHGTDELVRHRRLARWLSSEASAPSLGSPSSDSTPKKKSPNGVLRTQPPPPPPPESAPPTPISFLGKREQRDLTMPSTPCHHAAAESPAGLHAEMLSAWNNRSRSLSETSRAFFLQQEPSGCGFLTTDEDDDGPPLHMAPRMGHGGGPTIPAPTTVTGCSTPASTKSAASVIMPPSPPVTGAAQRRRRRVSFATEENCSKDPKGRKPNSDQTATLHQLRTNLESLRHEVDLMRSEIMIREILMTLTTPAPPPSEMTPEPLRWSSSSLWTSDTRATPPETIVRAPRHRSLPRHLEELSGGGAASSSLDTDDSFSIATKQHQQATSPSDIDLVLDLLRKQEDHQVTAHGGWVRGFTGWSTDEHHNASASSFGSQGSFAVIPPPGGGGAVIVEGGGRANYSAQTDASQNLSSASLPSSPSLPQQSEDWPELA